MYRDNLKRLTDLELKAEYVLIAACAKENGEYEEAAQECERELLRRKFIGPLIEVGRL
jgi:hypothetical protein